MVPSPPRRTLLSAASGLAATLLAGCTVRQPTTETGDGRGGVGGSALFDPDELLASSHDGFVTVDGAAYRSGSAALPGAFTDGLASIAERHGLRPADVDRLSVLGGFDRASPDSYRDDRYLLSAVVTGSFDAGTVKSTVRDGHGLAGAGTHRGATVYAETSGYDESHSRAYAVSGETLVGAVVDNGRALRDARDRITAQARTEGGADDGTPTLEDEDPEVASTAAGPGDGATATMAVERHLDALASGDGYPAVAALSADPTAPIVAGARVDGDRLATMLDGGAGGGIHSAAAAVVSGLRSVGVTGSLSADAEPPASLTVELRYASSDDADAGAVESFVTELRESGGSIAAALEHVDVSAESSGDAVTVDIGADPVAAYEAFRTDRHRDDPEGSPAPKVQFTFDRRSDGRVTVTHDGGDTVRELVVAYKGDGASAEERWTEPDGDVAAGDSHTTDGALSGGAKLVVVWESPDGDASATLAQYAVPS